MAQPYWNQPLPPQYAWNPDNFLPLPAHAAQQSASYAQSYPTSQFRVAPIVATYSTNTQKQSYLNGAPNSQVYAQYNAGSTVGSTTRFYPVTHGGAGLVTSPYQNASQSDVNQWHTVAVIRHQGSVWVHDPAYVMGSQTRLPQIPGTSNVTRLLNSTGFGTVNQVQVQGFGSPNQDCMGRSAQWLDNALRLPNATAPIAPDTYVAGQQTPGWQVVQRY